MIKIQDLSLYQLHLLVARAEGVEVVTRNGHVATEFEWDPEAHHNQEDIKQFKMWLHYEPTTDWGITGRILERERINLTTYEEDGEDEKPKYFGAFYGVSAFEYTGDTAAEAIIRSYVAKCYGLEVDMDNLPVFIRTAVVALNGFLTESGAVWDSLTLAEAERIALVTYQQFDVSAYAKWKEGK